MFSKRSSVVSRQSSEKGQSLMELIVVITVIVFVVGALTFATIASLRSANFAKNQAQATKLAQEALERVRVGRDRNRPITIPTTSVVSWNGTGNNDAIWDYHISGTTSSNCETEQPGVSGKCYFNVSATGDLTNNGFAATNFPLNAEGIPTTDPLFRRAVLLSDDLNENQLYSDDDYRNAKKATAVVIWKDASGSHQSKVTTILRRK